MTDRFQILSLDGGGIKGIFSAAVLAHLEDDLQIRITDHFDLLTGTSTGGIIALALGRGMRPREVVQFYVENGPKIFPSSVWISLRRCLRNKFDAAALEIALKECSTKRAEDAGHLTMPTVQNSTWTSCRQFPMITAGFSAWRSR